MNAQLQAFLELLWDSPGAALHDATLRELLGRELMTALSAEGLLERGEDASWFPCPGGGTSCPRTIHRDFFPGAAKPHYAMCHDLECLHVPVGPWDLPTSAVSLPALTSWLQRMMKQPEEPPLADPVVERAWAIGTQGTGSGERTVIAFLTPASHQLRSDLADIRHRYTQALVLMPLSKWASPELVQAHSGGAEVELAFLEHRLRFENGAFRWMEPVTSGKAEVKKPTAFALAFDGERRPLSLKEYEREVRRAEKVHVFIDITTQKRRRCRAGRMDAAGRYKEVWMPMAQANLLALAMIRQRPVRPSELKAGPTDLVSLLSRARTALDILVGRWDWTYFPTAPGEKGPDAAFVFRPPPGGATCCCVRRGSAIEAPKSVGVATTDG